MATRFEAMLATAMALGDGDGAAPIAAWRQIVDILAQAGPVLPPGARARAFDSLIVLGASVPERDRRLASASLAGRTQDRDIARLFAGDTPSVAAPFVARTTLGAADWLALIPAMPPASRNVLRNRRDLPLVVVALLARFARGDMALPERARDAAPATGGVTPIQELVERIAAYRERTPTMLTSTAAAQAFAFETTLDGTIDWVEGIAREALIGLAISEIAPPAGPGVDGQAVGAWRRRAPFTGARLVVAGVGEAGGDWLIDAAPLFNPADGRFCGYRGQARRPRVDERAADAPAGPADSLRQLVHEIRTPLNAIQGFAEMIELQLLGPVDAAYRDRAREVVDDVRRLVALVDDLDVAARLGSEALAGSTWGKGASAGNPFDLAALVEELVARHRPALHSRNVAITVARGPEPISVQGPVVGAERIVSRLLAAAASVAAAGEIIAVDVRQRGEMALCSISRPAALAGRDERTLLDPEYGVDGDWPDAPLLGMGFTLRLIGRLATQEGGRLAILPDRFEIALPHAGAAAGERIG